MWFTFAESGKDEFYPKNVAFCVANDINPKAVLFGSTFELTDDYMIVTREFELKDGSTRVWHDACCGATHYAKRTGRYPMQVHPEAFGFRPLLDASGNVAP